MQSELIQSVYRRHDIDVRRIGHVVAHGTGTRLGDPVELNALSDAFRACHAWRGVAPEGEARCAVTSCKSNVGHTMAASGLVSIVALLKSMQHGTIPATLHCDSVNEYVRLDGSPLVVNRTARPWPAVNGEARMGAVSAFGRSGTNAHVVIEQGESIRGAPSASVVADPPVVVPLSAQGHMQLREAAQALCQWIDDQRSEDAPWVQQVAYCLQLRRDAMPSRLAVVAGTIGELRARLQQWLDDPQARIDHVYYGAGMVAAGAGLNLRPAPVSDPADGPDLLAERWVIGADVDWAGVHGDRHYPPVSLPTYRFARERLWAPVPAGVAPAPATPTASDRAGDLDDLLDGLDRGEIEPGDAVTKLRLLIEGDA
jgi:acyl transferase domain-containing protein